MIKGKQIEKKWWLDLMNDCAERSVFQSPAYCELINETEGQRAVVFALQEGEACSALVVVTIYQSKGLSGFFSRRGIIYGAPLFRDATSLESLMKEVTRELASQCIYLELRNYFSLSKVAHVFENLNFEFIPYVNFELDLTQRSLDDLLKAMKYNRKREIRLSYDEGAFARCAESIEEVKSLYSILVDLYNNRVKLPLPSFDFFKNLFDNPKIGMVMVVIHNEKVIGGAFNLYWPGSGIYSMYYCGLRDYHKKIFPTHLAIVGTINWAQQNGCEWLDFMGAGKKGEEYGVRKYKEEFGGKLTEHGRYLLITQPLMYKIGQWGLKILARLKS